MHLSYNCMILSTNKGGQINFSVSHRPNKVFHVVNADRQKETVTLTK